MPKEPFTLSKPQPKPVPKPALKPATTPVSSDLPGRGRLPFRPEALTDDDKKVLTALGYKAGDAVPGDLPKILEAARHEAAAEFVEATNQLAASGQCTSVAPPVPIESLPAETQERLRAAMRQAQSEMALIETQRSQQTGMAALQPGVQKAAAAAAPMLPKHPVSPVQLFRKQNTQTPTSNDSSSALPDDDKPLADGAGSIRHCPHCNWLLASPEPAEPTKQDILDFVTSQLGGRPFVKEYSFYGGKLKVSYRSLSASRNELILSQLGVDRRAGRLADMDALWSRLWNYRLVASLYNVSFGDNFFDVAGAVDKLLATPARSPDDGASQSLITPTNLPEALEGLLAEPTFNSESNWRLFGQTVKRFSNLIEFLEARADDADFYRAIES